MTNTWHTLLEARTITRGDHTLVFRFDRPTDRDDAYRALRALGYFGTPDDDEER